MNPQAVYKIVTVKQLVYGLRNVSMRGRGIKVENIVDNMDILFNGLKC
jgi:hypothetical protein